MIKKSVFLVLFALLICFAASAEEENVEIPAEIKVKISAPIIGIEGSFPDSVPYDFISQKKLSNRQLNQLINTVPSAKKYNILSDIFGASSLCCLAVALAGSILPVFFLDNENYQDVARISNIMVAGGFASGFVFAMTSSGLGHRAILEYDSSVLKEAFSIEPEQNSKE